MILWYAVYQLSGSYINNIYSKNGSIVCVWVLWDAFCDEVEVCSPRTALSLLSLVLSCAKLTDLHYITLFLTISIPLLGSKSRQKFEHSSVLVSGSFSKDQGNELKPPSSGLKPRRRLATWQTQASIFRYVNNTLNCEVDTVNRRTWTAIRTISTLLLTGVKTGMLMTVMERRTNLDIHMKPSYATQRHFQQYLRFPFRYVIVINDVYNPR